MRDVTFGERVKAIREGKGLTPAEAGDQSRLGRANWLHYESGRRPNPTLDVMKAMAGALGVPLSELLEDVDE